MGRFAAKISMNSSGRPTLHMAFWDTGTGSHTVLRQMVAQELSVPVDEVDVELLDTSEMPFSSGSGGTRVTYTAGQAVVGAARELKRRLIREAAPLLDSPEEDVSGPERAGGGRTLGVAACVLSHHQHRRGGGPCRRRGQD